MWIEELWRYPVKSMAGEALPEVALDADGLFGDRIRQVRDPSGRILTARTRPALLGHRAVLDPSRGVLVDGRPWDADPVAAEVASAAGPGARIVAAPADERFDILPLLVATDGAIAALRLDRRRFRPNILVGGVEGLAERAWEGRTLRMGECLVAARDLRGRCVMTTFDPDSLAQDLGVLRRIVRELDGVLGLNCSVLRGGTLRRGDVVELVDAASVDPGEPAAPRPSG